MRLRHWLKMLVVGDTVANIGLQRSLVTRELTWAGIRYKLARDGTVEEVIHPEQASPAPVAAEAPAEEMLGPTPAVPAPAHVEVCIPERPKRLSSGVR